ncbi:MAG TPA: hypothetical protein VEJ89_00315 [Myxococcaceae bacterium]|nr:hypothetical protein [Myxococcaceae bacterium]
MRSMAATGVALALLVTAGLAGCKASLPPVTITDAGLGFDIQESIFVDFGPPNHFVGVLQSNRTGMCDALNAGVDIGELKSTSVLAISLLNLATITAGSPVVPGTYDILNDLSSVPGVGTWSYAYAYTTDASCNGPLSPPTGIAGSVTLASIDRSDGGHATGSYDITFDTYQRVQNPFDALYCPYTFVYDAGTADGGADAGFDAGLCL